MFHKKLTEMSCNRAFKQFGAAFLIIFSAASLAPALSQDIFGYERVMVDDGVEQHCIDTRYDEISVSVRDLVLHKNDRWKWFSETNDADIILHGRIEKITSTKSRLHAEMPTTFRADLREYGDGVIIAPIQINLLSQYPLELNGESVSTLSIDFSLINRASQTIVTKIVARLPSASRGLPLPPTPYTETFAMATQVIGDLLSVVLDDSDDDSLARQGRVLFEFNSTGYCGRNGAFAGTYAFIRSADNLKWPGLVDISRIAEYCFYTAPSSNAILFEKKIDGICKKELRNAKRLLNQHVSFMLAITNGGGDTPRQREVVRSELPGWSEDRLDPDATIVTLSGMSFQLDNFALETYFAAANRTVPVEMVGETRCRIVGGNEVTCDQDAAFLSVSQINQRLYWDDIMQDLLGTDDWTQDADDEARLVEVSPDQIVLTSTARCAAFGLDPHECY